MDKLYECAINFANLKKRTENPHFYCVTSFFKKNSITYGGRKLYWMLKEKINSSGSTILYKHKNFIDSPS